MIQVLWVVFVPLFVVWVLFLELFCLVVDEVQIFLCFPTSIFHSHIRPLRSFIIILRNPLPLLKIQPHVPLRYRTSQLSSLLVKLISNCIIMRHMIKLPTCYQKPKRIQRPWIPLNQRLHQKVKSGGVLLAHNIVMHELRLNTSQGCRLLVVLQRKSFTLVYTDPVLV